METESEWEKTKAYLVESLFRELPLLSFVSDDDAPSPILLEPCSPLPPLNIEVMHKPNPHDEPEEFYDELEIKMKKFYRKLFYKEDTGPFDDVNELSQYTLGYDSDGDEIDRIEMEKYSFDEFVRKKAIDFEDRSNANINGQIVEIRNEDRITKDERGASNDKSEDSTECSVEFRQVTCVAEVHREDINTDEAESIVYEEEECKSLILGYTLQSQVHAQRKEANNEQLGLGDNISDDEEKRTFIYEAINLDTISDNNGSNDSIDIMRSHNVRRHSMGSLHQTDSSSFSSPSHVDYGRSRSLDLELELFQVSTLSNPVEMEITSQNEESKLKLMYDSDSVHDNSVSVNDIDKHILKSKDLTEIYAKRYRMTSTPKSNPTSASSGNSNLAYGDDENKCMDDEYDRYEVVTTSNPNTIIEDIPDDKASTTEDLERESESTDDEYDTYEVVTISNPDMEIEEVSDDKKVTIGTKENSKDIEDKSVPSILSDKIERRNFGPATSTPKSRMTSTQSILEEAGSHDELNTAKISWSSSVVGNKRVLRELSEEPKRRKLIDTSVQTSEDNIDWNELKNNFFVGVPRVFKLCSCKHHYCGR